MKPSVRFPLPLWTLLVCSGLFKISQAQCNAVNCDSNATAPLETTITTTNITIEFAQSDPNCTFTTTSLTDLIPGAVYRILNNCSNCCINVTTKPEKVNPTVTETTTSTVSLSWTKPEGNVSVYRVQWTDGNTNNETDVTDTSVTISGLSPGVKYDINVTAVADDHHTVGQTATTSTYTEPEVVNNLSLSKVTISSVSLIWTKPEGNSSFYSVHWTDGTNRHNKNVTQTFINILNLTAGVQYSFTVAAVAGDETTVGEAKTVSSYTKPEVVRNLTVNEVTTSSVSLIWTKPEGNSSFYSVHWTDGTNRHNKNVTQTSYSITNLTAGVQYTITVTAVAGDGYTEGQNTSVYTYTKPEVVRNLTVNEVTTFSVSLIWTKPEGNSSFYSVHWTDGTNRDNKSVTQTSYSITNLTAGVQYTITVTAVAGDGYTEGQSTSVYTYTKPEVVRNLTVNEVTTSSVSLIWTKPEGNSSFYSVHWTDGTDRVTKNVTQTSYSITNLTAGVQYTITVTAVAGDGYTEGQSTSVYTYTKPEVVRNLTVNEVTTFSVSLIWTKPEGNSSFYSVHWTDGTNRHNKSVTQTSYSITNLTAGVQYTITVTAVAGDGYTEGQSTSVYTYTKPEVVRNLTVNEVTTSSVSLIWTKPEGNSSFYSVHWTDGTNRDNKNVNQTFINILNLTAGVQYSFTVVAVAGDETTVGEAKTVSSYTKPEVVRNLTVNEVTTFSVSLIWTKPEGNSSFYSVHWTDGTNRDNKSVTQTSYSITNLTAGVQYTITVTAVAGDGYTEGQSTSVYTYTKPEVVRNLTVNEVTTSSVSLIWTKPEGNSSFYSVHWTDGTDRVTKNVTQTSYSITNLTAGVQYTITVTAVAGDGYTEGQSTSVYTYTKPEVVRNLTVNEVTTFSVSLIWTKPEGNSSFYSVHWTDGTNRHNKSVTQTSYSITNLTAGVQYTITVTAVAGDGYTEGQSTSVYTYTKPEVVRNLTVNEVTTSSVSLIWTKPEGNSSFYSVHWTDGTNRDNKNVNQTFINILNLTAGVQYSFTVVAVAGDETTVGEAKTVSSYTKPEVVRNLTVNEVTTSSVSLIWTKPEGNSSFYSVHWTDGTDRVTKNVTQTSYSITNLTAGVQYTITVTAVAGDGYTEGQSTSVYTYTKPEVVRNLTVNEVTTFSVSLIWTKPEGNSSFYSVHWTDGTNRDNKSVTQTSYSITNLTAGVQYTITVTAVAGDGYTEGQSTSVYTYTKPEVVRNLTVNEVTTSSVSLIWTKPEGNSSFYSVHWTDGTNRHNKNVNQTFINILNLTAGVQYSFTVVAVAGDETTVGEAKTVSSYTKPEVVRNLTVNEVTTSSVSLIWTKPEGNSSFYSVHWTDGTDRVTKNVTQTSYSITNLTAGVQYTITVTAAAGDGYTEGQSTSVYTYTKPEVVRNLTVNEVTTFSVSLIWTKPEGNSSFYSVHWTDGTNRDHKSVTQTSYSITNLTAGVQYTITVTAVAGDGYTEGQSTSVYTYTKPEVVRNLTVNEVTTSSVSLIWTKPEGNSSFYSVHWTDGKNSESKNVTQTSYSITNLTAGVQYTITVTAAAGDGYTEGQNTSVYTYTKPEVVRNLTVNEVTTSSVSVIWTKPEGNSSFYSVHWTDGTNRHNKNVTQTFINILNLTAGVQYSFTVVAVAGDETTVGEAKTVSSYTKPEVVRNLTVNEVTTSSVSLIWTKPEGNSSFYSVHWTDGTDRVTKNVTQTSYSITNLTAGVQYTITVTAAAGDGYTEGQSTSVYTYTKPEVVRNLTVNEVTTSSVSLNWTKPEGNSSFYSVHWTDGTNSESKNVTETFIIITNLTAGVQYTITVTAVAGDGYTEGQSRNVSQYTKPGKILSPTVSSTTSSLSLNWTKPHGVVFTYKLTIDYSGGNPETQYSNAATAEFSELIPGTQYTVTITAVAGDNKTQGENYTLSAFTYPAKPENITANQSTDYLYISWTLPAGRADRYIVQLSNESNETLIQSAKFTGLLPGRLYNVTVTAVAGNLANVSDPISKATVPTPPQSVSVTDKTNSSLRLNWEMDSLLEGASDIFYSITYQGGDIERTENSTDNSTELSSLSSGTLYNITVITVGPQYLRSTEARTSAYTLPNPVVNLNAWPESTTSVNVTWSEPVEPKPYYRYQILIYEAANETLAGNKTTSSNSIIVNRLKPGTGYNISVVTLTPGSQSIEQKTFSYTKPKAVTNLTTAQTSTTIELTWSRQDDHKPTYSYSVKALLNGHMVKEATTEMGSYNFTNLEPGTVYTLTVVTVIDGVQSAVESTSAQTFPDQVSHITMSGTTTTMTVSWDRPQGRVDSYIVWLYNDSGFEVISTNLINTNTTFGGLKPGVRFCAVVITKTGNLETNSSEVCNATYPNPPGMIHVTSQTVHSINFTWDFPEDMEDRDQYNFSVSTPNGSFLIEPNWYLLEYLQSGTLYSTSVVTVGVENYKSTEVTTQNYTRPFSVTNLELSEITTNSVTLMWIQPEDKSYYSFLVRVATNSNIIHEEVVSNKTYTATELQSGTNYSFSVQSQTPDGTTAPEAVTVSCFTRPYSITDLQADTINTTSINLTWEKPLEYKREYTYFVTTSGCGSKNQTFQEEFALISALNPGTDCTLCVVVLAQNGIEGAENCTSQYTKPEAVQLIVSSQGSNSSLLVSWQKPQGNVEYYSVYLNNTSENFRSEATYNDTVGYHLFTNLSAGRLYTALVVTECGPFNTSSELVTNATFPNPPGPITVLSKTTQTIVISWEKAPLMAGALFHYQLMTNPNHGDRTTNFNNYTFFPLVSGTPHNISVKTVGVMDFMSETVESHMITTKPFSVTSLQSSQDVRNITLTWEKPMEYKDSYRFYLTYKNRTSSNSAITTNLKHTFKELNPGSSYTFNVTTETLDKTQSDTETITSCTTASQVTNPHCQPINDTNATFNLSWSKPDGEYTEFKVEMGNQNETRKCCFALFSNLRYYTNYTVTVTTQSCGKSSTPVSHTCMTGITNPPIPSKFADLVEVIEKVYNKFTLRIEENVLNNTNGPIKYIGVLVTDNLGTDSSKNEYLSSTYNDWKAKKTTAYLATIQDIKPQSRSTNNTLTIQIGDESTWEGYSNGPLEATGQYRLAIVLFTDLKLSDKLIDTDTSLSSTTDFYIVVHLPQNPATIGIAVGVTLGIFCILFFTLIGFIIYWRRVSNKEASDIQIHSMRAKVSIPVRVEDYEAYYKKQKADSNCGFAEEFEDLKVVGTGQSKTNALNPENKPKNRYNNVLPYDSSRVKLSIVHGSPFDDYINANYMPGYNSRKEFIAAQGPLPTTVNEFWRMIWEKNVRTLVMLTRCNEQGRVKCEQYWDSGTKHYENITVTTTSEIPLEDWTIRDFDVKNVKTAETRSVRHFHFTAWPDHRVPETTELLISFRHLVREHMDQYSRHSPTVVHCSAGVGRTGTLIAIDRLIFQIERENIVDIYGIVHDLRMHRNLMVQTEDQYVFLNQCAMDIIRSRTGTNVDLIYQNTAALSIYENVQPNQGFSKNGYHNT
ncbi:receptor-type tyrosine-protein phosphatase beta isoform X5 [Sphaeramia orbicularis]|uniref:receptor-type tyrosine-protein phosphatase beta isoform X5 n=1 Tax=Sphaeramia orbicularis TaxID=375764 RepID=UPI00117FFC4B|nr:receptor-type tyrosine-protein phosphatase beta-like isoform X5 [Sphaeramia orbicularis]